MTENKRFNCTDNGFIIDYQSEQKVLNLYGVVDLLNELAEENEKLKQEAEVYNEDAMSYQTLYEQQVEKNKKLNQLIKKIEDNLNKYKLINCLEYEDWKKEIWGNE